MKHSIFTAFQVLVVIVLAAKILNWFLNFNDLANHVLNTIMFSLIGVAYIVMGYRWDMKITKVVITTCGLYLIAMNFFNHTATLNLVAIACILIPMLIARLQKEKQAQVNAPTTK